MRILHTSDWHLGRSLHRESLLGAQAAYVDHLVATARAQRVDLIVVSGDVYDRALPGVDAVALAHDALRRLADLGVPVVITSGNHDSPLRLGFAADLIAASGVHLRTDPARLHEPVLLDDADGPVAVYGLPYLEPELLREPWGLSERSHRATLGEAMDRVRADLAGRSGHRSVALAHAWVTGAEPSESERDISVGGISHVPLTVLDGIDYVALGHLHGAQQVGDRARYSGSPLAYSFSESRQVKGSWLIDLDQHAAVRAEFVEAPVPRALGALRGHLDDLLADPSLHDVEQHWLEITLTDPLRPRAAMERLQRRFPHALVLRLEPEGAAGDRGVVRDVRGRRDRDLVGDFVSAVRGHPADPDEAALLDDACAACAREPLSELVGSVGTASTP